MPCADGSWREAAGRSSWTVTRHTASDPGGLTEVHAPTTGTSRSVSMAFSGPTVIGAASSAAESVEPFGRRGTISAVGGVPSSGLGWPTEEVLPTLNAIRGVGESSTTPPAPSWGRAGRGIPLHRRVRSKHHLNTPLFVLTAPTRPACARQPAVPDAIPANIRMALWHLHAAFVGVGDLGHANAGGSRRRDRQSRWVILRVDCWCRTHRCRRCSQA